MIIDVEKDPMHCRLHEVCDAATLRPLGLRLIFYADDSTGIIRRYFKDEHGEIQIAFKSDPHTPLKMTMEQIKQYAERTGQITNGKPDLCFCWREERRPIQILRRRNLETDGN